MIGTVLVCVLAMSVLAAGEPLRKRRQIPGLGVGTGRGAMGPMGPMGPMGMGGMADYFYMSMMGESDIMMGGCAMRKTPAESAFLAAHESPEGMGMMVGCACVPFQQCESTILPTRAVDCGGSTLPYAPSPFVCCCGSKKK